MAPLKSTVPVCIYDCVWQDYGLDVSAFRKMVSGCPQHLLELAASCCLVSDLLCI